MYDGKTRFLVENSLNRYLVNSAMLRELKKNKDGGITLYLQHKSPGPEKESNWLPAPDGVMGVVMRLYLPKPEALNGAWKAPPIDLVGSSSISTTGLGSAVGGRLANSIGLYKSRGIEVPVRSRLSARKRRIEGHDQKYIQPYRALIASCYKVVLRSTKRSVHTGPVRLRIA